jgi:SEC-C motif
MRKRIGRNSPCPCGSGKKYKKCCGEHAGTAVVEVLSYGDNLSGVFSYVNETHMAADTGEIYRVRIYSSVEKLIASNDELKKGLCSATHNLLFPERGDTCFANGAHFGLPEDIMIWHDRDEHT